MRLKILLAASSLVMVASPVVAGDTGQSVKVAAQIASPPAGMGQIVFYRSSMMGALISCRVHEAGTVVNKLPPGHFFVYQTTPGIHEFTVKSEAKDVLRINVEEGETAYARCAVGMGIGMGRPNLSTQSREDFDKRGKGLKLQPPFEGKEAKGNDGKKDS